MRRLLQSVLTASLGVVFVQVASAADFPVKAPVKAAIAPPYSWTGFYVGANVGYGWQTGGSVELLTDSTTPVNFGDSVAPSRGTIGSVNGRGAFAGGQIGFNWQFPGNWVAGLETDFQYSWIRDSVSGPFTNPNGTFPINGNADFSLKWFGTLRGRIGIAADRWLVYATGGLAYGQVAYNLNAVEVGPGLLFQSSMGTDRTRLGFVLGAGVEYAFAPNLTMKVEYQYIDLGSVGASAPVTLIAGGAPTGETATLGAINVNIHTVRVGLNYRFN